MASPNVSLVSCDSAAALVYSVATGQITRAGAAGAGSNQQDLHCLTAVQRQTLAPHAPGLTMSLCNGLPDAQQQFQYNPSTGALRQKGSECIADYPGTLSYRDCCIALCTAAVV